MNPPPTTGDLPSSTSAPKYRTVPEEITTLPPGIPYIIGNEAAERFSYYGMKAVLFTFMTKYLLNSAGVLDVMGDAEASAKVHLFNSSIYALAVAGALLADAFLGKYRTIISLSLVYCLGHLALSIDHTRLGLLIGMALIALGAGGIKPCVSAHVGDQFGQKNQSLLEKVFGWFYLSINIGAFISTLLTPWLLQDFPHWLAETAPNLASRLGPPEQLGPHVAFALPGVLMLVATWVFWLGRNKFVHVPPRGKAAVLKSFTSEGGRVFVRLLPIFFCTGVFWSLGDQTSTTWVAQLDQLDRNWGWEWGPGRMQAINPFLVLLLIPAFSYGLYPLIDRVWKLTALWKMTVGLFLAAIACAIVAWLQQRIDVLAGMPDAIRPSFGWQFLAIVLITAAEVMIWVPCLEFSYTQAPPELKSFIMSIGLLSISLGNIFTSLINKLRDRSSSDFVNRYLNGANYFWFYAILISLTAFASIVIASTYRGKSYAPSESTPHS